jgi:hypothetical protein
MLECKEKGIYDVGFVDPYIVNEKMLQQHPKDVEHDLFTFLSSKILKGKFYFLTTSGEYFKGKSFLLTRC